MNRVAASSSGRTWLWCEFLALFVGVPIAMAAFLRPMMSVLGSLGGLSLFIIIWALAGVAASLLAVTPGFKFRRLLDGPVLAEWRLILLYALLTTLCCAVAVAVALPERAFDLPLRNPALWALVIVAYPLLSAWPQELIYRSLFFERYGRLFPGSAAAIAANGIAFGIGHLFYMNAITIALTAAGGALIGWAYLARGRSMLLAWALHSLSGWIIFTSGLGIYFYSGNPAALP